MIRDGLKSIAAAVNRTFSQDTKIIRVLRAKSDSGEEKWEDDAALQQDLEEDTEEEAESASNGSGTGKKTGKTRKAPSYSYVKDLNLQPTGKLSFKDFAASKNPEDSQAFFAISVYYLTKTLELQGVGPNHIYSCFKEVGKSVPTDLGQLGRNVSRRKGWLDTSNGQDIKLTTKGENFVEHELP